jgi:vanillate/4-hydroxybenzoate decarboxylase subunit D
MNCPRCDHNAIDTVATSPVPGVWEVYGCGRCSYMWRSTEPADRSIREGYPVEFRITQADIDNAIIEPEIQVPTR